MPLDALRAALVQPTPPLPTLPLLSMRRDAVEPQAVQPWDELVVHQVSQHCAAWFDAGQARWRPAPGGGLYAAWAAQLAADRGLPWARGRAAAVAQLRSLPAESTALVAAVLARLGLPPAAWAPYLTALLASVGGWAAWCAYERWQARLCGAPARDEAGGDGDALLQLLAIRLAWEALLSADAPRPLHEPAWAASWAQADAAAARLGAAQRVDWLLQAALEVAYRHPLSAALAAAPRQAVAPAPALQAVFCIDVRSEVLRRALEAADPGVQTLGFAGFFGLPIAYRPAGSALQRPQLPGLLAPALTATEQPASSDGAGRPLAQVLATRRTQVLQQAQRWDALARSAASGFSFVEACGLAWGARLLADSLPGTGAPPRWEDAGLPAGARGARPVLALAEDDADAAAALALGILRAMGLTSGFAPLVLLAGHGSQSANNPHAAGLDCGACGGQTGEVNARVLADLLNRDAVRSALAARGLPVPPGTHFLAGLHNTTLDEVQLFDTDAVPPPLHGALDRLRRALAAAGRRARAERAPGLGLPAPAGDADALLAALRRRANDWSQVRPEWGLADNAAFVVAPRARTAALDLGGRSFLHDYDWRRDEGFQVLALIMTAPMVVTNWINLQYHASTVDNRRYGSGNKVLHNVVGARLGVFEGNGGDLRIGLPLQSLHDGERLRHKPRRLAVYIEAPRAAIDGVLERHAVVRELVAHGWLRLLRIAPEAPVVERRDAGGWVVEARAAARQSAAAAAAAPGGPPGAGTAGAAQPSAPADGGSRPSSTAQACS